VDCGCESAKGQNTSGAAPARVVRASAMVVVGGAAAVYAAAMTFTFGQAIDAQPFA
jgi:hypothetical protein